MPAATMIAIRAAVSAEPGPEALHLHHGPFRRERVAEQRDLQQDQEHDVEAEDDQDRRHRSVVQLVEVTERGEIGDAREA